MKKDNALDIAARVHDLFKKKGLTLSVAESCTGGLISHYITAIAGASEFFEAGAVTYSKKAKMKILGVSGHTLETFGAISPETAIEMAEKTIALLGADFSLSTTGNLGPGALEGKERGLIYIGVSSKAGKTDVKRLNLSGSREENKEDAAAEALMFLLQAASA